MKEIHASFLLGKGEEELMMLIPACVYHLSFSVIPLSQISLSLAKER